MGTIAHDLRLACRSLVRRPGLTLVAMLTLSLGTGASTTMFTLLHDIVIRPLPYPRADRLVQLFVAESGGRQRENWTGANFVDFCTQSSVLEAVAGYRNLQHSVREGSIPVNVRAASVTPAFFQVFGVPPHLGRTLSPTADAPGGARAVVLAHGFWTSHFGADPAVVGRTLDLDGESYTVVGVMPQGFEFPHHTQLWSASRYRVPEPPVPLGDDPAQNRGGGYLNVVARARSEVSLAAVNQEAKAIAARLERDFPDDNRGETIFAVPLHDTVVGDVRPALLALFGAVGLVLLIACANVANLLLARATGRAHEIAIRTALGAGRWRLARQLLTESVALGVLGGLGGVVLAYAATHVLVGTGGIDLPRAGEVSVDLAVLGFSLAVSVLSGMLFGVFPAVWLTRADPAGALRAAGGRGLAGGAHGRMRATLIVAEIAVCLALLVGAGLLARTLAMLGAQDPGFSERGTLTARVNLPGARLPDAAAIRAFQTQVLERIRALPGVASAGTVLSLPIDPGVTGTLTFHLEGRAPARPDDLVAGYEAASDGYFETMGIPVLTGRAFTSGDTAEAPPVAVVSQAFASRFFPGEDPLGKRITWGNPDDPETSWSTIVGVVGNVRLDGLDAEPRIEAYQPMAQAPWPFMAVVLRGPVPPESLAEPLRRAVAAVSPTQPVEQIQTMEQVLHDSLARRRATMLLLWVFAGLALAMATIGLYGVMSFAVAQRGGELGVRMALGADARSIRTLVLREAAGLLAAGLAAGGIASLVLGRLMSGFLYQVRPSDPVAFAAAGTVLTVAALVAAWVPAHRAARTDPMRTLRME